ncbi:MAG: hypothetical protein ABR981_04660 [Candidatus Micrarchaeaceae archaeon]|jgi:hypothetical protein
MNTNKDSNSGGYTILKFLATATALSWLRDNNFLQDYKPAAINILRRAVDNASSVGHVFNIASANVSNVFGRFENFAERFTNTDFYNKALTSIGLNQYRNADSATHAVLVFGTIASIAVVGAFTLNSYRFHLMNSAQKFRSKQHKSASLLRRQPNR